MRIQRLITALWFMIRQQRNPSLERHLSFLVFSNQSYPQSFREESRATPRPRVSLFTLPPPAVHALPGCSVEGAPSSTCSLETLSCPGCTEVERGLSLYSPCQPPLKSQGLVQEAASCFGTLHMMEGRSLAFQWCKPAFVVPVLLICGKVCSSCCGRRPKRFRISQPEVQALL